MPSFQLRYLLKFSLICIGAFGTLSAQTADFTSDIQDGCSPLTVNFQDLSSGSGLNYLWDFGNGNQSTQKNPGAIYIQDGTYTIKLKVWNTSGSDSITKTAYIHVFAKPVAKFGLSGPVMGCAPVQVSFRDSSQPGSYPIQSWLYDFGDGSVSTSQHPQHTYQLGGSYSVSLQVTDTKGCSHVALKNQYVKVGTQFPVDYTVSNPVSCSPPLTTSFQSNVGGGLSPYSYYWDFDDGNTSNAANPSHTFTGSKIFLVSLRVTDSYGCAQTVSKNSVNTQGPKANYQVNATSGCVPFRLSVKDASIPPASNGSVSWTIGPFQSHSTDTSVLFTQAGTYDVKWKTSAGACADSVFHQAKITVFPSPEINFSTPDTMICKGSALVQFLSGGKDVVSWK
ncbi:MAG: PKD domain-containing protein, partial [Bacteroidia bacterium]